VYRRRCSCDFVTVFTWQCRGSCQWLVLVLSSQTQLCQLRYFNDYTRHMFRPLLAIFGLSSRELKVLLYIVCTHMISPLRACALYRVSQEECARLRESVPYVKVYRYNPKHLYTKLNGYRDNGQRKVGASCGSKYCNLHSQYVT